MLLILDVQQGDSHLQNINCKRYATIHLRTNKDSKQDLNLNV